MIKQVANHKIDCDLFNFAYIPAWYERLHELKELAQPEPWQYKSYPCSLQNTETPILERYIQQIFKKQAIDYEQASDMKEADKAFYIRNETACLHTGLYTPQFRGIYMLFEKNKKRDTLRDWYFKGFVDDGSEKLKYIPLPQHPMYSQRQWMPYYNPSWELRISANHILKEDANVERLPEKIRGLWNLPFLLETAVELVKRMSYADTSIVALQIFQGRMQYLLPIHMTDANIPDVAMAVAPMDGYYVGHTCLTLPMAYQNARLLGRPIAGWLKQIVE